MISSVKKISLAVGQWHTVKLDDRGGAGHVWQLEVAGNVVELESDEREVPDPLPSGGPAPETYVVTRNFTLKAVQSGQGTATFTLERPWTKDATPAETLVLEFEVSR